jgi:hypothetical protein
MLISLDLNQANALVHNFNWHSPSWDLFIFLFWAVASMFYAFSAGRGKIISLLMSLYIAKLLVLQAPWLTNAINQQLPSALTGLQQLVSFLLIFIILFVLLSRFAFRTSADGRRISSVFFSLIFALLQIGLLINTILSYLAVTSRTFSPLVNFIFISKTANFIWLVLPLIYLIVLGRTISDTTEV